MAYWGDLFQEWQDIQKQFIDNLPFKIPNFDTTNQQVNPWTMPHLQTFISWGQSAVNQSMELQTHWLSQWTNQMENVIEKSTLSKADMLNRVQESMSGWSENQSELWEYWFKMVEETSSDMENPDVFLSHLDSWKETINESLSAQTSCLECWSQDINVEELSAEELMNVSFKMQETMNGWLVLQNELWQQWFGFLSLNENIVPADLKPSEIKTKATKNRKSKPSTAAKPQIQEQAAKIVELTRDNLEVISGIGPALAKKLYAQGIVSLKQIADLTDKEIAHLEETIIKFPGRIHRENWTQQAQDLLNKLK